MPASGVAVVATTGAVADGGRSCSSTAGVEQTKRTSYAGTLCGSKFIRRPVNDIDLLSESQQRQMLRDMLADRDRRAEELQERRAKRQQEESVRVEKQARAFAIQQEMAKAEENERYQHRVEEMRRWLARKKKEACERKRQDAEAIQHILLKDREAEEEHERKNRLWREDLSRRARAYERRKQQKLQQAVQELQEPNVERGSGERNEEEMRQFSQPGTWMSNLEPPCEEYAECSFTNTREQANDQEFGHQRHNTAVATDSSFQSEVAANTLDQSRPQSACPGRILRSASMPAVCSTRPSSAPCAPRQQLHRTWSAGHSRGSSAYVGFAQHQSVGVAEPVQVQHSEHQRTSSPQISPASRKCMNLPGYSKTFEKASGIYGSPASRRRPISASSHARCSTRPPSASTRAATTRPSSAATVCRTRPNSACSQTSTLVRPCSATIYSQQARYCLQGQPWLPCSHASFGVEPV